MKKLIAALLCLCCLTAGTAMALEIEGKIQPAKTLSIRAPYSGMADDVEWAAGDEVLAGDALAVLSTTKVYADFDGTVTGIFAQAGDSAASVAERYGALMYVEREALYTAQCTTSGAASDNENKIVHAGETVYIRSTADSKREGVARVTGVSGNSYTLEVVLEDDLKLNDSIKVYRDDDFDADSCIGMGKLSRIDPVAVTAEGSVLAVHVQPGQKVARGEVLLEIVPDVLEGMKGGDGSVYAPQDGVLLSVLIQGGEQVAKELAKKLWDTRKSYKFRIEAEPPAECVRRAIEGKEERIFITDSGDNTTAGAEGDTTEILELFLAAAPSKRVCVAGITDFETVNTYWALPDGAEITLEKFGARGRIRVHGEILGWTKEIIGRSLTVSFGNVDAIFTELRSAFIEKGNFDVAGVDLLSYEIVTVKLGYLFTELKPYAKRELFALSDGASCVELERLNLKKIQRPMYPLDEFEFDPFKD
ncbi:MAG: MlrC C-terminal domain-containing protein [Oscillospiraceae bacterium]|nr:MlrC C-terminal domain-containing protein [Oscillospiraceae bacterium]